MSTLRLMFPIIILKILFEVYETDLIWTVSNKSNGSANSQTRNYFPKLRNMPLKRTTKWIVVTSVQAPTEDVMKLASYPEWTLVVVGDTKTPLNWSLPDVHYLSLDAQAEMEIDSVNHLPTRSCTRKNARYLYAIANDAEWIYDTDDDNKPYGKGLEQFDYSLDRTRGLRFTTIDGQNGTIQESLFNPYRHFGRPDLWPRGFPLEHLMNHDHHDGSYRLCREQRPPAVQQGIVHKDPDVDAIYPLLHADSITGLDESFNQFAPPIILAPGTFAPWNSQNTLFSRAAFFGLFLPTTVSFRTTDIWRSYFTQALLHAAGESVSFVPVNAIQQKNAHNYSKHYEDDIDNKAGEIVSFINNWKCRARTLDRCTFDLAREFAARGFWGEKDAELVEIWIRDLHKIGYVFPKLQRESRSDYPIGEDADLRRNCRRAHIALSHDLPLNKSQPAVKRAASKIDNYGDLKDWCMESSSEKSKEWSFPDPEKLAASTANSSLVDNQQNVAIITNNYQWGMGMGVLQRMYDANFAMVIFCGHYPKQSREAEKKRYPEGMAAGDSTFPNLRRPFNYIDLSNEEVRGGYLLYYCLSKVEEMKLQNVKGYVMFSDDMIFNFWNPLNVDVIQGSKTLPGKGLWLWRMEHYGLPAMKRTIKLFNSRKYSDDAEVALFVEQLKDQVIENDNGNTFFHNLLEHPGRVVGDWIYIPAKYISIVAMFAQARQLCVECNRIPLQLAHEGELFHELFTYKITHLLPSEGSSDSDPVRVCYLWDTDRPKWNEFYNDTLIGIHPVKLSKTQKLPERTRFCDAVLDTFYKKIFRNGT